MKMNSSNQSNTDGGEQLFFISIDFKRMAGLTFKENYKKTSYSSAFASEYASIASTLPPPPSDQNPVSQAAPKQKVCTTPVSAALVVGTYRRQPMLPTPKYN